MRQDLPQDKDGLTLDATMLTRLDVGKDFYEPVAQRAERNAGRYLGSERIRGSTRSGTLDPIRSRTQGVGEVNYLGINLRQKVANTAIHCADFILETVDGNVEDGELVRKWLRELFERDNIPRVGRRCLLMQGIGSQSHVRYFWDSSGFGVEYVDHRDLAPDPLTTDAQWSDMRWANVRVRVSSQEAIQRYGSAKLGIDGLTSEPEFEEANKEGVQVWIGYDRTTECEILDKSVSTGSLTSQNKNKRLVKRRNLYGRVPVITLQGDHDPETELSVGDYDTELGAYELLRRMQRVLAAQARNGGGVSWVREEYVEDEQLDSLMNGDLDTPVKLSGASGQDAIGFTPNQALNPAMMEVLAYVGQGLDAGQAVTQYDRGVASNPAKFATEASLMASRSTARATQKRIEFEYFLCEIAKAAIRCFKQFGLDPNMHEGGQPTPEDIALFRAMQNIRTVRIIEESTSFKDPADQKQSAMQMLQVAAQLFPVTLQAGEPLDIWAFIDDALRAFNRMNLQRYRMEPQKAQALMQSMAQQAQAGQAQGRPPKQPTETLNYKDAPEDIKRQIEQQAGLQPSREVVSQDNETALHLQDMKGQQALEQAQVKAQHEQAKLGAQVHLKQMDMQHQQNMQSGQQGHEATMRAHDIANEHTMASRNARHQSGMAREQRDAQAQSQASQQQSQQSIAAMGLKAKARQQSGKGRE